MVNRRSSHLAVLASASSALTAVALAGTAPTVIARPSAPRSALTTLVPKLVVAGGPVRITGRVSAHRRAVVRLAGQGAGRWQRLGRDGRFVLRTRAPNVGGRMSVRLELRSGGRTRVRRYTIRLLPRSAGVPTGPRLNLDGEQVLAAPPPGQRGRLVSRAALFPGDIVSVLVGGKVEEGLLVRVVAARERNGVTTALVKPASLFDVVPEGQIRVSPRLRLSGQARVSARKAAAGSAGCKLGASSAPPGLDVGPEVAALTLFPKFVIDPDYALEWRKIFGKKVVPKRVSFRVETEGGLSVRFALRGGLSCSWTLDLTDPAAVGNLLSGQAKRVVTVLVQGLKLSAALKVTLVLKGKIQASSDGVLTAAFGARGTFGAESSIPGIPRPTGGVSPVFAAPAFSGNGRLDGAVAASLGPAAKISIPGIDDASVGVDFGGEADLGTCRLDGVVAATAAIKVAKFLNWTHTFASIRAPISGLPWCGSRDPSSETGSGAGGTSSTGNGGNGGQSNGESPETPIVGKTTDTRDITPDDLDASFPSRTFSTFVPVAAQGNSVVLGGNALTRYLDSGELDSQFGTSGSAGGPSQWVELDPQGRILTVEHNDGTLLVQRFTANGQPDSTFSGDGRAEVPITDATPPVCALVPPEIHATSQAIFVSGAAGEAGCATLNYTIAKLDNGGGLESGFGVGGLVTTPGTLEGRAPSFAVSGNRLLTLDRGIATARSTATGAIDTGFGANGELPIRALDVAARPSGGFLARDLDSGAVLGYTESGALTRTLPLSAGGAIRMVETARGTVAFGKEQGLDVPVLTLFKPSGDACLSIRRNLSDAEFLYAAIDAKGRVIVSQLAGVGGTAVTTVERLAGFTSPACAP